MKQILQKPVTHRQFSFIVILIYATGARWFAMQTGGFVIYCTLSFFVINGTHNFFYVSDVLVISIYFRQYLLQQTPSAIICYDH